MGEVRGHPTVGGMTGIALDACTQMTRRFGTCATTRTMAGITDSRGTCIVHPTSTNEGSGGMTGAAIQLGRQVSRHRIILTRITCTSINVTTIAACSCCDRAVIVGGGLEGRDVMACSTVKTCWYMAIYLATGKIPIMTTITVISNAGVIKAGR